MQEKNKTLILFTAQFPFGEVSETFLETEIHYLAKAFKNVIIIPTKTDNRIRETPANIQVITEYSNQNLKKTNKLRILFLNITTLFSLMTSELKDKGFKAVWTGKKTLIDIAAQQIDFRNKLNHLINQQNLKNTIFYDYWFCNKTLALSMLKKRNKQLKLICRTHRYDLYDDNWKGFGVPFRLFKTTQIDKIFFISQEGLDYFKEKVPSYLYSKLKLSYLGVPFTSKKKTIKRKEDIPLFVSVSRVVPFKNVNKIPKLLEQLNTPIKWIHFGDGIEMGNLKEECKQYKNVIIELKGNTPNPEIYKFFNENHIDFFISLSDSEGLPVSMMEAQSFGIPILSTEVGGVNEIVKNETTGFLLSTTDEKHNLNILKKAFNHPFNREEIIRFFKMNFEAEGNYSKFTKELINIR